MIAYQAPLKDLKFVLYDLLHYEQHYQNLSKSSALTRDDIDAIMVEAAKFSQQVIAPLNRVGDEQGCQWHPDGVTTPDGFKEAYQQYIANGWPLLAVPEAYGGQGLPESLSMVVSEMISAACVSWSGYPGLTHGAINTLMKHGTKWQQQTLLPKLVSGQWTGTMCLTESHCGSDLGQLRTKAVANSKGTYNITGTKTFISCGEHDVAENIVHIVLARIKDAPSGTAGLSLFAIPKILPSQTGELGQRNQVRCGSIEHKMGVHGFVTCEMNFDQAQGYLIGEPNKGLACMFTFMNFARITTAMQGVIHAEIAYQGALPYAKERLSMRSLSGTKNPTGPADPIIVHPDVRRMLMTIKAIAEGSRSLVYFASQHLDIAEYSENTKAKEGAEQLLSLITPICKGFLTELGVEAANLGLQVLGGHGYIRESGMEQNVRDSRISTIYEGTTGIQALDLLGRKVLGSRTKLLQPLLKSLFDYARSLQRHQSMCWCVAPLNEALQIWQSCTATVADSAVGDADEVGAAAHDYLMISGYAMLAYLWARMASVAEHKMADGCLDESFYRAKIHTAQFYFKRILPRIYTHNAALRSGASVLMGLDADDLQLNS